MSDLPVFTRISHFFQQDGHLLRPTGQGRWSCLCPFHSEKSGSCVLNDEGTHAGTYHCFGCGAGTSVYDYLMQYRHVSFLEAVSIVRAHLNLPPDDPRRRETKQHPPGAAPAPTALAAPLGRSHLDAWREDSLRLLNSPADIARIAEWRGYDPTLVQWAAAQQHIGLRPAYGRWCYGQQREAFPVRRPLGPTEIGETGDTSAHIGIHIRLGPGTAGNAKGKASYRFDPQGIGSWPLVIGDPAAATCLFFIEGQWDALALVQLLGWHLRPSPPITSAIIALRGAANWRLWLAHQTLREDATAFLFPDNDEAGSVWVQHPPPRHTHSPDPGPTFVEALTWLPDGTPRIARTHTFAVPGGEKDLNDALKKNIITPADLRASLLPLLRPSSPPKKRGTFLAYCRQHRQRPDIYGTAARSVAADTQRPPGARPSLKTWVQHWQQRDTPEELATALIGLYTAYLTGSAPPPVAIVTPVVAAS